MALCPPVISGLPAGRVGLLFCDSLVVILPATSAWSALTLTCLTVICC